MRALLIAVLVGGSAFGLVEACGVNEPGPTPFPRADGGIGTTGGPPNSYDGGLVPNDGGFQDAPMTVHLDGGSMSGDGGGF